MTKEQKDAMAYYFNNPVGATPVPNNTTDQLGRHQGIFQADNPYNIQMQESTKKHDIDALYERAVEWEADYANRQMQLQENREILEEQREYDSPEARIARERAAGINSDIAGSSSGQGSAGSSAQLTNPGMADQQGQSKFSNAYDNTATAMNVIGTVANSLGTFVNGYSSIVSSIDTMRTLPYRTATMMSEAQLGKAQADEITALLDGKKTLQNAVVGSEILGQLSSISHLNLGADDNAILGSLSALGIGEDDAQRSGYLNVIKQFQANPELRDKFARGKVAAAESEAYAQAYTPEVVAEVAHNEVRTRRYSAALNADLTKIQSNINSILAEDDNYAKDSAEVLMNTAAAGAKETELQKEMIIHNFEAWGRKLDYIDEQREEIAKKRVAIESKNIRKEEKDAYLAILDIQDQQLSALYSNQLDAAIDIVVGIAENDYFRELTTNDNGDPVSPMEKCIRIADRLFNGVVTHEISGSQAALELGKTALNMIAMFGAAGIARAGMKAGATAASMVGVSAAEKARLGNIIRQNGPLTYSGNEYVLWQ